MLVAHAVVALWWAGRSRLALLNLLLASLSQQQYQASVRLSAPSDEPHIATGDLDFSTATVVPQCRARGRRQTVAVTPTPRVRVFLPSFCLCTIDRLTDRQTDRRCEMRISLESTVEFFFDGNILPSEKFTARNHLNNRKTRWLNVGLFVY